jgi:hypothetical protein
VGTLSLRESSGSEQEKSSSGGEGDFDFKVRFIAGQRRQRKKKVFIA